MSSRKSPLAKVATNEKSRTLTLYLRRGLVLSIGRLFWNFGDGCDINEGPGVKRSGPLRIDTALISESI